MPQAASRKPQLCLKLITLSLKVLTSGVLALLILSFFCFFYRDLPISYPDPDKATVVRSEAYSRHSMMLEGCAWGRANNEGYNNPYDYGAGMNIDILVMGSSHVEGFYVMSKDIVAALLGRMSGRTVYNIGMGGHYFPTCADNLEAAVKKYKPSQYVVIETHTTSFKNSELNDILSHSVNKEVIKTRGIIRETLKRSPYVRFLQWKVYSYIDKHFSSSNKVKAFGLSDSLLLSNVLVYMRNAAASSGAKVIVLYHPRVEIDKDGNMIIQSDPEAEAQFSRLCAENGIYFIDMSRRFLEDYARDYTLPYGFANTSLTQGHTNKYGTRMYAEEIYSLIQRIEAEL